jgi:DNA-binding winged helix-turn-helix (wHTH) protein
MDGLAEAIMGGQATVPGESTSSSFHLDVCNQCLLQDSQELPLRPKTFAVLRKLLKHAGQLVSTGQLLDAVWPETHVSDLVLKVSICELRKAFGDDPKKPRFIRTVHRRGYRFIGELPILEASSSERGSPPPKDPGLPAGRRADLTSF